MDRKGNGLANPKKRGRDLKKYFEVLGSGSNSKSNPSTRESVNISAHAIESFIIGGSAVKHSAARITGVARQARERNNIRGHRILWPGEDGVMYAF